MDSGSGPKLKDVAKLARCSPTTVSRVLNDHPFVSEEVRERVRRAAQSLGYVPNGSARALRSTRSRIVGIVIPTLKNAIYATMVDALEARLSKDGVSLIIGTSSYDAWSEHAQVTTLVERGAEAIVLVGHLHRKETIDLLNRQGIPHVYTYTSRSSETGASVGFDNTHAGAMAAEFLHSYGHRRFGMISGLTKDNDRATERRDGFVKTLAALGIKRSAIATAEAPYTIEGGVTAMRTLLAGAVSLTAVFCGSDTIAAGVVKFCNQQGMAVPGDLSVLGFDNLEIAELTSPQLSTIEVPAEEMGLRTAEYILAPASQRVFMRNRELNTRLIVRGSTGPAPRGDA